MNVVRTHELSKSFRHTHALEKLNLEIPEGSIFALVGPNGAGKTTAIKTLMNILRPSAGSAEVLGTDSRRLGPAEFSQIGYVSENQELPLWMCPATAGCTTFRAACRSRRHWLHRSHTIPS
jgi:ABC-2 type transport system ATP-binding protein